jgi:hypothetical protein
MGYNPTWDCSIGSTHGNRTQPLINPMLPYNPVLAQYARQVVNGTGYGGILEPQDTRRRKVGKSCFCDESTGYLTLAAL